MSKELKDKFTEYVNVLSEINRLRHRLDVLEDYSQKLSKEIIKRSQYFRKIKK